MAKLKDEKLEKVSGGSFPWKQVIDTIPGVVDELKWVLDNQKEVMSRIRNSNPSINLDSLNDNFIKILKDCGSIDKFKDYILNEYGVSIYDL